MRRASTMRRRPFVAAVAAAAIFAAGVSTALALSSQDRSTLASIDAKAAAIEDAVKSLSRDVPKAAHHALLTHAGEIRTAVAGLLATPEPQPTATTPPTSTTTTPPTLPAGPDPKACTGYPEPRIFYETQSWWEPVPGLGGQGHVHLGVCWPHGQTVSGIVRLDFVALFHGNRGVLERFKVKDDRGQDISSYVNTRIDSATQDVTIAHTMYVDTRLQPDGLRQWRLYAYLRHDGGNQQIARAMYRVDVENVPGDAGEVGPAYSEYGGSGWYKEADGTDWGYQYGRIDASSHLAIGTCVSGTWTVGVDMEQSGTTEHIVTVDPSFHAGNEGWIVHGSAGGYDGPVPIDTTRLANGWHKLVVQSARRIGDKESGGVFAYPFRVCN